MSLSFKSSLSNITSSNITSAPVSPQPPIQPPPPPTSSSNVSRGVTGLLSRATSLTGTANFSLTNTVQQIARATSQVTGSSVVGSLIKDRHKILLIIDDHLVDWSKYFRGRRLIGDWDIKVEQAEFKDINLQANSDQGTIISIFTTDRSGYRIARTFRPDFVLIRQHINDCNENYRNIIIGLKYGMIPAINSLQSFYNFQDKSWIFANLLTIQRKCGKDAFPLIEQTFYQSYKDTSGVPKLPCVVKIGSSSSGLGKVKIDDINQYQDIRSILMINNDKYCTIEPFIDSKCDLILQKIGNNYKAFTRKSVSGNWKANIGAAILEQIPINDRYKKWIDDVSDTFGGLDICSIEGVISNKDDKELLLKVHGSDMLLLGEQQEEDRKNIVELIIQKMNIICKNIFIKQQSRSSISNANENESIDQQQQQTKRSSIPQQQQQPLNRMSSRDNINVLPPSKPMNRPLPPTNPPSSIPPSKPPPPPPPPPSQQPPRSNVSIPFSSSTAITTATTTTTTTTTTSSTTIINETNPFASSFNPTAINDGLTKQQPKPTPQNSEISETTKTEEVDDTMKNLRKTFAGIFGDM